MCVYTLCLKKHGFRKMLVVEELKMFKIFHLVSLLLQFRNTLKYFCALLLNLLTTCMHNVSCTGNKNKIFILFLFFAFNQLILSISVI